MVVVVYHSTGIACPSANIPHISQRLRSLSFEIEKGTRALKRPRLIGESRKEGANKRLAAGVTSRVEIVESPKINKNFEVHTATNLVLWAFVAGPEKTIRASALTSTPEYYTLHLNT